MIEIYSFHGFGSRESSWDLAISDVDKLVNIDSVLELLCSLPVFPFTM